MMYVKEIVYGALGVPNKTVRFRTNVNSCGFNVRFCQWDKTKKRLWILKAQSPEQKKQIKEVAVQMADWLIFSCAEVTSIAKDIRKFIKQECGE